MSRREALRAAWAELNAVDVTVPPPPPPCKGHEPRPVEVTVFGDLHRHYHCIDCGHQWSDADGPNPGRD